MSSGGNLDWASAAHIVSLSPTSAIQRMTRAFFIALITFLPLLSNAQAGESSTSETRILACRYRLVYQPDSANGATRTEYMRLAIGKTLSKFESEGFFLRDSLIQLNVDLTNPEIAQKYVNQVSALPQSKFRYSIYKIPSTGKLYCYDRIGYNVYSYNEPANPFKWKIIPGQNSIIAGYSCQKATTTYAGRSYEAWFTREVPISEGPYKFYGLPGLIIKVSDSRKHYNFELINVIKPKNSVPIALLTKDVLPTTKTTLRRGQLDYESGMLDRVAAMGNKVTEQEKQVRREKIKRQNNPLELK